MAKLALSDLFFILHNLDQEELIDLAHDLGVDIRREQGSMGYYLRGDVTKAAKIIYKYLVNNEKEFLIKVIEGKLNK